MPRAYVQLVNLNGTLLLPSHELHVADNDTIFYLKANVQSELCDYVDGAKFRTFRVFPSTASDYSPSSELHNKLPLLGMEHDAQHPLIVQIPTTRRVSDWNSKAMEYDNEPC